MKKLVAALIVIATSCMGCASEEPVYITPTFANVSYGPHPQELMDCWLVSSPSKTGIVVSIHGGSWSGGSKEAEKAEEGQLSRGYSYCAIDYPLSVLPEMTTSAARAIQFIRYNAVDWNIDTSKIVVEGNSAGGALALWVAFHDDLADPASEDEILRYSSRVSGVYATNAQTTLNVPLVTSVLGTEIASHNMFSTALGTEDSINEWLQYKDLALESSAITHISADDPPLLLLYDQSGSLPPANLGHAIHHPQFGDWLVEKCDEVGLDTCDLRHTALPNGRAGFIYAITK